MRLGSLPRCTIWRPLLSGLLMATVLAPFATMAPAKAATPHAQPALLALAARRPSANLHVIVQREGHTANVAALIAGLGGHVSMNLSIINAVAATLPARAVTALARSGDVRWVSLDAPVVRVSDDMTCGTCGNPATLQTVYDHTIGADRLWNEAPAYLRGQGVGVAVVDSGVNPQSDFYTDMGRARIVAAVQFNGGYNQSVYDGYGHGNHVAGIIGGNGRSSNGAYIGVAPLCNIINVKVSDDQGQSTASNVVRGLQWILENKSAYNIRVVNLSLNSGTMESYNVDPIDAAVEVLWFNGLVVVTSSGNNGANGGLYPPANDPFVITVGATDDHGTASAADDTMAPFSAYGTTADGFAKPDLVAPGTNIVSLMAAGNDYLAIAHPDHIVSGSYGMYFRMSGTSMAAPMVSGAAALLVQSDPTLTPDQVKYRLKATARPFDTPARAGAGYLDVYAAVHSTTMASANTGIPASKLLWSGSQPVTWSSVNWNSVNWNSVNWNSVNWNSVNWNSVNWNSDYWG